MPAISSTGPAGTPACSRRSSQSLDRAALENATEDRYQIVDIGHTSRIIGKSRIFLKIRAFQDIQKAQPVGLIGGTDGDPAIGGFEGLIGGAQGMGGTERSREKCRWRRSWPTASRYG